MYDRSESCVRENRRQTDFFAMENRVRQGGALSLLFFKIVLVFVMRNIDLSRDGIEQSAGPKLEHLACADDICLLANALKV